MSLIAVKGNYSPVVNMVIFASAFALATSATISGNYLAGLLSIALVFLASYCAAKPSLLVGLFFFCLYTNSQQVLALWHDFRFLTEVLVVILLAILLRDLVFGQVIGRQAIVFFAVLLPNISYLFASSIWSKHPTVTIDEALGVTKHGVIALLAIAVISNRKRLEAAIMGIVLGVVFMAFITITQYYFSLYHLNFGGYGVVTYHHISGDIDTWRVDGPLTDPNYFAQVLVIGLPFAVAGYVASNSSVPRIFYITVMVMGIITVFLTYSRGALVALAALVLVGNYRRLPRLAAFFFIPLVFCAFALTLFDSAFMDRIGAVYIDVFSVLSGQGYVQDEAINGRLSEMLVAWHLFLENPLLGAGFGQYEGLYQDTARYYSLMARGADRQAHSLILEILAERGLVGLALYVSLVALAVFSVLNENGADLGRFKSKHSMTSRAVLFALFGYYVTSIFLHDGFPMYFWLLMVICYSIPNVISDSGTALSPQPKTNLVTVVHGNEFGRKT